MEDKTHKYITETKLAARKQAHILPMSIFSFSIQFHTQGQHSF